MTTGLLYPLPIVRSIFTRAEKGQALDILVRSSSELKGAFANANDGDIIKLAPGDYGSVRLRNKDFDKDVTITSADSGNRAVFDDYLEFNDVSGVTVEGVNIDAASLPPSAASSRIQIIKSQDVTLRDMLVEGYIPNSSEGVDLSSASRLDTIAGYGHENGMRIKSSEGISLENIEFRDLRKAISVSDSNNTEISNINVHDVREGININDVSNTLIEDSWFHNFEPIPKDHPDMIQFWGTDSGVHGLIVRNNLLDQSDGQSTQSIFGHFNNRPDDVTGSDFIITENIIINHRSNGIRIREIDGFEISNNILLPSVVDYDYRKLPGITVLDSENGEITGNTLLSRWDGSLVNLSEAELRAANIEMLDNIALSTDSSNEFYWQNLLNGERPNVSGPREDGADKENSAFEETPVEDELTPEAPPEDEAIDEPTDEKEPVTVPPSDESEPEAENPTEGGDSVVDEPVAESDDSPEEDALEAEDGLQGQNPTDESSGDSSEMDPVPEVEEDAQLDSSTIDVSQVDIVGTSGRDWLRDTEGNTTLTGLGKNDAFIFDYREDTGPAHDVIVDFSFSDGDQLTMSGSRKGTFDDSIDTENSLLTLHGGTRAHIRSADDLREAAEGGAFTMEGSHHGNSLILTLEDAPDRSIELIGLSPDDFLI